MGIFYRLFLYGSTLLFLCFQTTYAGLLPENSNIIQYLKYEKGCKTNVLDCYQANSIESNAQNELRGLLSGAGNNTQLSDLDRFQQARDKIAKEQEDALNQAKSVSSKTVDPSGCIYPVSYCDEQTLNRIRGQAISSGLTPNANQLEQCSAQIDEYKKQKQDYDTCQNTWRESKVNNTTRAESLPKKTSQDSIIKNKINGIISCVITYGELAWYNSEKDICTCSTGSKLDLQKGVCIQDQEIQPTNQQSTTTRYGRYADLVPKKSPTKVTTNITGVNASKRESVATSTQVSITNKTSSTSIASQPNNQADKKINIISKIKNRLYGLKFYLFNRN